AGAGGIAAAPARCMARKWPWRVSATVSALAAFVVAGLAYAGRAWLPPVPLSLASHVLAWNVGTLESLEPVTRAIKAADLSARGLVAYTAVYAPADLKPGIRHVWQRRGEGIH